MTTVHTQNAFTVRFDWGLDGARQLGSVAPAQAVFVVVDVLSFTTAVGVACDSGIEVFPFRWKDERAEQFAAEMDATLARGRSAGGISLSPASIRGATGLRRLVLPSPNGSTITAALQDSAGSVIAASLRNAEAVGRSIAGRLRAGPDRHLCVIAAGERWPGDTLRPAVEDLWGAGAVISAVLQNSAVSASPEARSAAAAYHSVSDDIGAALEDCASGRELAAIGFGDDVAVAAELNSSDAVPTLDSGCYRSARR